MKVADYSPSYTTFGDLNEGDVFFYPAEDDICMKTDDYGSAVILRTGCLVDIEDHVMIAPISNAKLIFD